MSWEVLLYKNGEFSNCMFIKKKYVFITRLLPGINALIALLQNVLISKPKLQSQSYPIYVLIILHWILIVYVGTGMLKKM